MSLRRWRAHARDRPTCVERSHVATRHQRRRYPPRRKAGLTVSKFGRKAFRQDGRTATEARVRSPSEVSAFQAETERWSGIRTRDRMIHIHLLYQTELSFVCVTDRNRTGDLRVHPDALPLSYYRIPCTAEHETGNRLAPVGISESPNPWPSEGAG